MFVRWPSATSLALHHPSCLQSNTKWTLILLNPSGGLMHWDIGSSSLAWFALAFVAASRTAGFDHIFGSTAMADKLCTSLGCCIPLTPPYPDWGARGRSHFEMKSSSVRASIGAHLAAEVQFPITHPIEVRCGEAWLQ
jgi:hypothetical protein